MRTAWTALRYICATAFFQLLLLLMCVASGFTFEATNVLFCPQTIVTAGSYNISCSDPSERLIVIGCSPPVNNSFPGGAAPPTDPGVVSIQVLRSPSQLTVSDSSVFTYLDNSKSTLAGCSIHITYLAPVPSAVNLSGNVLVALKTSLAELRILLHSRLTLGGSFVWIRGLDEPNASIGVVSVVAGPKSSFVCGGSHSSAPRCSVSLGASFVRFLQSPPITKLLVVLNGTDVTMATWRLGLNISSFALVLIDNVTSSRSYPVPDSHSITLVDVIGAIAGSRLLALLNPYQQYDRMSVSYPQFAGHISARNCSFVGGDDFVAIFDFSDLKRTTIALESISVLSFLLNVVRVNTSSLGINEMVVAPLFLTISRSDVISASSLITFGIVIDSKHHGAWNTVVIRHSNITIRASSVLLTIQSIKIDGSAASLVAALGSQLAHLAMNFTVHHCVVSLVSNTAGLLAVLGPGGSTTQAPFPTISNSTVRFEAVLIEQLWQETLFFGWFALPAVSIMHLKNVSNTTIAFVACDVSVRQVSPASAVLPTALLLEIHGMFLRSSIVFERSSFAVDTRENFTAPSALQMPIIGFSSDVTSTTVNFVASNFTNIPIITSGTQLANLRRSTSAVFMVGCHNRWCQRQQTSSSDCTGLSISNVYNKTEFVESSDVVAHCTSTSSFTQPTSITPMITLTPSVSHSLEFVSATPVPILSRTLAAAPVATQIFTVAIAAPLASAVLATSVAGVIQRSTVVLQFSTCTIDGDEATRVYASPPRGQQLAVNENPTRLSFGSAIGSMYRGAAVGNSALLVGVCAAVLPAVALYRCFSQSNDDSPRSISCSLARLRLPSRVFVVLTVLLQPTATACAGLLFLALSGGDVVLAVAAALLWLCVILWFVWAVQHGCSKLVVSCMKPPRDDGAFDFILERPNDWVPQPHLTRMDATAPSTKLKWIMDASEDGAKHFALQFSVLIAPVGEGTYRQQYYCFGCLWSVITGVVGALDPSAASSCQLAQVTLVAVAALSLVSLVAIRPYTSKFDQGFQTILELLSLIAAVLILTGAGASGGVMSISYAQIGISFIVSLLRGANRVLLWCTDLQWTNHSVDKKKKKGRQMNPTCSVEQHLNLSYCSAGESVVAGSFTHSSIRNSSFHPPCDHDYTPAPQCRANREFTEQRRDQLKYLIEFITSTR